MAAILVSGLINIETTLRVDQFPIPYLPVRYSFNQIDATVSGVGYNIAKALTVLGNEVEFFSIIGEDPFGDWVKAELKKDGIPDEFIVSITRDTARSVILYDRDGNRQINLDLKEIQQLEYPLGLFDEAIKQCKLVALCNINFSRPMLERAHDAGKIIATDVHTINDINDQYNRDFMEMADILFMSDEVLPQDPVSWAEQISSTYGTEIVVIGLGREGALMSVKSDQCVKRFPAVNVRPVVNTIGAGDALFSAFLHSYLESQDPYEAIRKAILFASYKIGEKGAAEGFLSTEMLDRLYSNDEIWT